MRSVFWFLLLFVLAVVITLLARLDAGYVVISLPPWRLEMSFLLAAILLVVVFSLGYFGVRMTRLALRLPSDVRAWHRRRSSDKAEDELSRAIAAYLSGQTAHALALARSSLKKEQQTLAVLIAAYAAMAEGNEQEVEVYLKDLETEIGEVTAARQAIEARLGK